MAVGDYVTVNVDSRTRVNLRLARRRPMFIVWKFKNRYSSKPYNMQTNPINYACMAHSNFKYFNIILMNMPITEDFLYLLLFDKSTSHDVLVGLLTITSTG